MSDRIQLKPLSNKREAPYYPEGSMELHKNGAVWIVTPNDIRSLFILTSKEMVKRHEQAT